MDFNQQLQTWAKGDANQGRLMFVFGILLGVILYFLIVSDLPLYKGMRIPTALLCVANLFYGGFLAFSRPKHILSAQESYSKNPKETLQKELKKSERDDKTYTMIKPLWTLLNFGAIIAYFIIKNDFYKGLALSLIVLFWGFFLIDTFLQRRLKPYLNYLQKNT